MKRRTPADRRRSAAMGLLQLVHEPAAINAAQVLAYVTAGAAGLLAALGGVPTLLTGTIGPIMSVFVGGVLVVGGAVGAFAVLAGHWWLERVALLILALGWVMVLPASLAFALSGRSSAVWLVVALVIMTLSDIFKRFRRIDWAYLDPTK
jgi:hypothetical protein